MLYQSEKDGYPDALRSLLEAISVFEEEDQERGLEHLLSELTMIGSQMMNPSDRNAETLTFRDDVRDLRALFSVFRKEVYRIANVAVQNMSDPTVMNTIEIWRTWRQERPEIQEVKDYVANYIFLPQLKKKGGTE